MGRFSTSVFEQLFSLHTLVLLAFSKTGHDWLGPVFCGFLRSLSGYLVISFYGGPVRFRSCQK
jgi:hypothetical protein